MKKIRLFDFVGIFQDFYFYDHILDVPRAVLDVVIKMKRRKRPQKQTEFQFFHSLKRAAKTRQRCKTTYKPHDGTVDSAFISLPYAHALAALFLCSLCLCGKKIVYN